MSSPSSLQPGRVPSRSRGSSQTARQGPGRQPTAASFLEEETKAARGPGLRGEGPSWVHPTPRAELITAPQASAPAQRGRTPQHPPQLGPGAAPLGGSRSSCLARLPLRAVTR